MVDIILNKQNNKQNKDLLRKLSIMFLYNVNRKKVSMEYNKKKCMPNYCTTSFQLNKKKQNKELMRMLSIKFLYDLKSSKEYGI